jgi:glycosyltransferase involved in cell wall biosynthesis
MTDQITPLILTYNEAPNIRRTLERLTWARQILVIDSFSTDETLDICKAFPQVRVIQRKFDTHSSQWNFGLDNCTTDWVLALDADYVLSDELVHELQAAILGSETTAYFAHFQYCISGRPLRGTLYPPRAVLFRKSCCRYEQDGHTQTLKTKGVTGWLRGRIFHDDRKSITHWLAAQDRYARLEVEKLFSTDRAKLSLQDRIRRQIIPAPFLVLFYTLFAKGLILDGWPGWYYAFQRTLAEIILSLRLIEAKFLRKS